MNVLKKRQHNIQEIVDFHNNNQFLQNGVKLKVGMFAIWIALEVINIGINEQDSLFLNREVVKDLQIGRPIKSKSERNKIKKDIDKDETFSFQMVSFFYELKKDSQQEDDFRKNYGDIATSQYLDTKPAERGYQPPNHNIMNIINDHSIVINDRGSWIEGDDKDSGMKVLSDLGNIGNLV